MPLLQNHGDLVKPEEGFKGGRREVGAAPEIGISLPDDDDGRNPGDEEEEVDEDRQGGENGETLIQIG